MISDHQWCATESGPATAHFAHCPAHTEQTFHRYCAERDDNLRLNDLDLFEEIWSVGLHLQWGGYAIPKRACRHVRPAFQNVCDVNVLTREPHRFDDFRKQLSGASNKRLSLCIFIRAR